MDFYVINLLERTDRFEILKKDFNSYNLIRVEALKHRNGKIGCFLSHQRCIEIAKSKNLPYICVIEDDCVPCENFKERLESIKQYLDTHNDWQLFIGGGCFTKENNIIKKIDYSAHKLVLVDLISCTHFIIYHNSVYDFFLNYPVYKKRIAIDKCWWGHLKAIVPLPFLAHQRPYYSNISNKQVCMVGLLNKTEWRLSDAYNR